MATPPIQPLGVFTSTTPASIPDANSPTTILIGKHVILRPLTTSDIPSLYATLCGPLNATLWTYLPSGPFTDLPSFTVYIQNFLSTPDFPFAIFLPSSPIKAIGIINLMSSVPIHRRLEIGSIAFAKVLQRSTAASEALFLVMRFAFEGLGNERVEWKCDSCNVPSQNAARRFGWRGEGVFLKHMVIKGHRRDTQWFSIIDDEWNHGIKAALEAWLDDENFDEKGKQKRKLEDIRAEILQNLKA